MAQVWFSGAAQFGGDAFGQHLAQLHAPLVERVDVPDHALGEHAVLVQRHQRPQHYSIMQEIPWQDRPLVKRRYRKVVKERLGPQGEVVAELDESQAELSDWIAAVPAVAGTGDGRRPGRDPR